MILGTETKRDSRLALAWLRFWRMDKKSLQWPTWLELVIECAWERCRNAGNALVYHGMACGGVGFCTYKIYNGFVL